MGAGGRLKKERIYILHADMLSCFSPVQLFVTLWTVAHQSPLSMGFSRQEYRSGLLCPPPGNLPDPGIEPVSPMAPALQVDSLPLSHQGSPSKYTREYLLGSTLSFSQASCGSTCVSPFYLPSSLPSQTTYKVCYAAPVPSLLAGQQQTLAV